MTSRVEQGRTHLALRLEGYSGADIVGLVETATDAPFQREIETGAPGCLTQDDLYAALVASKEKATEG